MAARFGSNSSNSMRAAATVGMATALNTGSTNSTARLLIYTGTQPSTPETSASGTLLCTVNFANPAMATSNSTGVAGLASSTSISATIAADGTAGWFRIIDRNGNPMIDGSIGTSGQDLNFDSVTFVTGGTCTITAFSITTPM